MATGGLVMLFDGDCAFCDRVVQTVLRYDRVGTLKFAPLQSDYAAAVKDRHPWLKPLDTLVVVEQTAGGERVSTHSGAALRLARYLGGWWRLALVGYAVPRPLRDWAYRLFARHRYRLFGKKADSCRLPTPAERARFIAA